MREVRIGVVGAGGAAQVIHLPILSRLPDVRVVALVDADGERARTIAGRFGIETAGSGLGDLDAAGGADAVLVCTPTDTHEELVCGALERGAHVLCERPLAFGSSSVRQMVEAARSAERHLMVALNQRYRLDVRAIRQFIGSGELGDIVSVRSAWLKLRHRRPNRGWRTDPARAGGGVLMDLGVQAIDVALWLLEYPAVERITARFHGLDEGVEDSAIALLSLADGGTVSIEVTWALHGDRERSALSVHGTRGSASTAPLSVLCELETGVADVTPPIDLPSTGLYEAAYRREWSEFLRLVRGEQDGELPEEQVDLLRIVEACYRSAREGREIALGEPQQGG